MVGHTRHHPNQSGNLDTSYDMLACLGIEGVVDGVRLDVTVTSYKCNLYNNKVVNMVQVIADTPFS